VQINPEQRGKLPPVEAPIPLNHEDCSRRGWKLAIPGMRPLATPAVVDDRVFLGGGFGSYEFYCLDAATGELLWQYQTSDDGPTAAVVADGYVVFNTESCELEVLTIEGTPVWKQWLGDPLMSMPAVHGGRVFMAYPDTRADHQHFLACFDVTDGTRIWRTPISGEIITAPVLTDKAVYFATLDGTMFCCSRDDGRVRWQDKCNATSSPVVVDGHCYFSQREEVCSSESAEIQQMEHCVLRADQPQVETRPFRSTSRKADYLDFRKRCSSSAKLAAMADFDAAVGFAVGKGSSKIHQAMQNLGYGSVSGVWAYQGSKPFFWKGRLYSSLGDTVTCVATDSDEVVWQKKLCKDDSEELVDSVVTPPAIVNDKVFVGTANGEVFGLSAATGDVLWQDSVNAPIDFQLSVVGGHVYVATRTGALYCLETADVQDDGWAMWGGTAAHNGLAAAEPELCV
jgi:outer membrane protein assembly factor BamB